MSNTTTAEGAPAGVREFTARSVGGGLALLLGLVGVAAGAGLIATGAVLTAVAAKASLIAHAASCWSSPPSSR